MRTERIECLYKAVMDPLLFKTKDPSLAIEAKISREFESEFEDKFMVDKMSRKMVRNGTVNITVDTKEQRDAYLLSNFGVETTCTDMVPYDGKTGQDLLDMLSKAKDELGLFQPPTPTLRCSYREYEKINRIRSTVKVNLGLKFTDFKNLLLLIKIRLLKFISWCVIMYFLF